MRWLLLKDLTILRRSPLLVGLLVIYPIAISCLIGFALSRGPDKPAVAILNEVPASSNEIALGSEQIDVSQYSTELYEAVDPVFVESRAEAEEKVRSGAVLAALIIPADITSKLQTGLSPATVEVLYNAEDPVKAAFVQDTIKAQVQDANLALTQALTGVALEYLDLIVSGGEFDLLGQSFDVLGLERSQQILEAISPGLSPPDRAEIAQVVEFAGLAGENLALADNALSSLSAPIRVQTTVVEGGRTPLSSFAVAIAIAVSLMFVTLLLASGTLALEREENAYARLTRGLVAPGGLLAEKVVLAAVCSLAVTLLMLVGLALFVGLEFGRAPMWIAALALAAAAFAAMGVALGALTRDVRAASLLAFMIALPIAFLALVPSGAVSPGLFGAITAVNALFPFAPTLDALDWALNGAPLALLTVVHLAALVAGYSVIGRVALRRFG